MTLTDRQIQQTCQAAASALDVAITTPFVLVDADGQSHTFIALFEQFGSAKGVLICQSDDWVVKNPIALRHGYYCSGLHPQSYSNYDRGLWIETFEEWGWLGPEWKRPSWCRR